MQGDFTRWTYEPAHDYRSVLMQQGRVLLDAEWNEQAAITAHHDETRTHDIVGRAGGPAPASGPGGFAVVADDGNPAVGTAWTDLVVTSGRYYVDGVLAESWPPLVAAGDPAAVGWPLGDQPFLASTDDEGTVVAGLAEPEDDGRYAAYLDLWSRQVTGDEAPELLEPALGGPDTATREQTVWQVKLVPIADDDHCSTISGADWLHREPRLMTAGLRPPEADTEPCEISAAGGYQRLENQLYRVQIHDPGSKTEPATFLWSRENGSVVAGLDEIEDTTEPGMDDALVIDRLGRDDELSIHQGDLIEVTSTDRELHGLKGYLAVVGQPDGLTLPVSWLDTGPGNVGALGRAPIVRRWDGGPTEAVDTGADLEGGIFVVFPDGGRAATGDYWLVPARTVRLAYGVNALRGTIEWPTDGAGDPVAEAPRGPTHHRAPLAILTNSGGAWTQESDCRRLFPPLTQLVTIDLVGGDGQEALPGEWLDEPVRVVVRNGGLPVVGADVSFTADAGELGESDPPVALTNPLVAVTGTDGVAFARWRLDPAGSPTQTLEITRLSDVGDPIDVTVVATARLSVAREVAWDPACQGFAGADTVQKALDQLVTTREIRLLGGDGQQVAANGETVPQPVRVMVDSPCGPIFRAKVTAFADGGGLVDANSGQPVPPTLVGTGATDTISVETGDDGVAGFAWQPGFANGTSAILDIRLEDSGAPIRVTAQLNPPGAKSPGVHITRLRFATGRPFVNDMPVGVDDLARGIIVDLDEPVIQDSVRGKPVVRVVLDLPWPVITDGEFWSDVPIGFRRIELDSSANADGALIVWSPDPRTSDWLVGQFPATLEKLGLQERPVLGRFIIDGWAIVSEKDPRQHLNGHAAAFNDRGSITRYDLPTDDEIAGGTFDQWFWLSASGDRNPPPIRRIAVPDLTNLTRARAERLLADQGLVLDTVIEESSPGIRKNTVLATEPPLGTELEPGTRVVLRVSSGING